jgi:type IV secretion system protein VirB9
VSRTPLLHLAGVIWAVANGAAVASAGAVDSRVREVMYDPHAVVNVLVKRGVVTHVLLDADESITDVASGLGSDCSKPEAVWCVAAQGGGRSIFVKAKSGAGAPNNLAVVTDKRTHSFTFSVLSDGDSRSAVYRLLVKAPVVRTAVPTRPSADEAPPSVVEPPAPTAEDLVAERLSAMPSVVNSNYSIAEGKGSADIVPTLVFDDGRFTYLRFPGNRDVPAVFHVLDDGRETLVNTRMEDDLLVVDRVSRRLTLRSGSAMVGVWNEAFDLDGTPLTGATTVPGVERLMKNQAPTLRRSQAHVEKVQ